MFERAPARRQEGPSVAKTAETEPLELEYERECSGCWTRTYWWSGRLLLLTTDDGVPLWDVAYGAALTERDEAFLEAFTETLMERLREEAFDP